MSDQEKNSETPEEKTAATEVAADVEEQASEHEVGEELKADVEVKVDTMADPESEIAELKDKLLRNLAEMENLRRRSQKDREEALKYASANFARDMLTVADNLRRAIESIPEEGDPDGAALLGFIEGIALTEKELLSALERQKLLHISQPTRTLYTPYHESSWKKKMNFSPIGSIF